MKQNNALNLKDQILFWIATTAIFLGLVWIFSSILLPFVVGITVAYLLNPLLVRLGDHKVSRGLATVAILLTFLIVVVGLFVGLLPPVYQEVTQLGEAAPAYFDSVWGTIQPYVSAVEETVLDESSDTSLQTVLKDNMSGALSAGSELMTGLVNGGRALVGFTTFIIVSPLVAFFMMIEWESITQWVDDLLPRHSYDKVKTLLSRIDRKIAGFVRGQVLVAFSLGLLYAIALSVAGLEYGFLIGIVSGILSIIPLFGSTVGLLVGILVAWLQSSEPSFVAIVGGIFLAGQFLEGNFITPKLMGDSVGLHPLWILFALMAGGALFGLVGMVLAVPVAATAGVLMSFALEQYKESQYYKAD